MKLTVELEMPEPRDISIDPAKSTIVVIDMENEFCAPSGKKYIGLAAEEAVRDASSLLGGARQRGVPVIWVQSVREPGALEVTAFHQEPHLIEGTWAVQYTPPLEVLRGEPIFKKQCHDCFTHTGLEAYLADRRMTAPNWTMVVVGVALPVCVNHAVLGFSVRNYRVVVPLDCVAPREGPGAAATLWRFGHPAYSYNIAVSRSDRIRFDATSQ
ncbi:MAG TPA: isochorismatase family cysteine hydrolase [Candidatus Binatia bacterium]|jgi:ureidoacrylate peracid hydrolase